MTTKQLGVCYYCNSVTPPITQDPESHSVRYAGVGGLM